MTEEQLISRMKKGKRGALEELIARYSGYVVSIIAAILGDCGTREDVEELASDVFLGAWRQAEGLTAGKLRQYLGASARNAAKGFLRQRRELPMDFDELTVGDPATPETALLQAEQRRQVHQAVDAMPEPDREIFLRYYYYLETTPEIAAAMGLEPCTVRSRLSRGRKRLKQQFEKEDTE